MANHYEILGVQPNATDADLKAAFRQAARDNHPDKGGDHDKMAAINTAYETLNDPTRREHYDRTGDDANPGRDAVQELLLQVVAQTVMNGAPHLLNSAKKLLRKGQDERIAAKAKLEAQYLQLKERRPKTIAGDGDTPNVFHMIIDQQMRIVEGQLAQLDTELGVIRQAEEVLGKYMSQEIDEAEMHQKDLSIAWSRFNQGYK